MNSLELGAFVRSAGNCRDVRNKVAFVAPGSEKPIERRERERKAAEYCVTCSVGPACFESSIRGATGSVRVVTNGYSVVSPKKVEEIETRRKLSSDEIAAMRRNTAPK